MWPLRSVLPVVLVQSHLIAADAWVAFMATASAVVSDVRRLAVLRANAVGDFVVTLPALQALRTTYRSAQLTLIGDAWLADLLPGRPGPWDKLVVAPHYPGMRGLPSDGAPGADCAGFLAEHRAESYDIVIQLHGGGRNSNEFVAALQARVSVGARTAEAQPLDRWVPYVLGRHETLRCLEITQLVGADIAGVADLEPRLAVTAVDLEESHEVFPGEVDVVVHAGATDPRRRWAAPSFVELIHRLQRDGRQVVLIGGPADRELARRIDDAAGPGCADVTGRLSLRGTLGLLDRAQLFVGNDSGPRQLAVAVGTPTVGIFWIANLLTFGPLVGNHRAAAAYQVECPVCGRPQLRDRCDHDVSLVDAVTVEQVMEAVSSLSVAPAHRTAQT